MGPRTHWWWSNGSGASFSGPKARFYWGVRWFSPHFRHKMGCSWHVLAGFGPFSARNFCRWAVDESLLAVFGPRFHPLGSEDGPELEGVDLRGPLALSIELRTAIARCSTGS